MRKSTSPDCPPAEQAQRVADAFCTPEERRLRNTVLDRDGLDCTNFNIYLDSYCTRNQADDGRYCLTRDGAADTENYLNPIRQNCQSNQSCTSDCRESLSQFQNDLGCCLNVVYNDTARVLGLDTFPLTDDSLFRLCGLKTPESKCTESRSESHAETLQFYGFTLILLCLLVYLAN